MTNAVLEQRLGTSDELLEFLSKHPGEIYTAKNIAELLKKQDIAAVDSALAMLSRSADNYLVVLNKNNGEKADSYKYDKDCAEAQIRENGKLGCCMSGECGTTRCLRTYNTCHSEY